MSEKEFIEFIEFEVVPFIRDRENDNVVTQLVVVTDDGHKAILKRNKHGYYNIKYTFSKRNV